MKTLFLIICVLSFVDGGILVFLGYKFKKIKPNYQVEKTLSGDYVRFLSFDETDRIKKSKLFGVRLFVLSLLFFGFGVLTIVFGFY